MDMITITQSEYEELIEAERSLSCLSMAGVDNWDGYEYALGMYSEMYPDEDDD